jgi:hypothetical protein
MILRSKCISQHFLLEYLQSSFIRAREQVSHPYKTTNRIIILYCDMFVLLETPFGLLLLLFTTSLVVTTIAFTMCAPHFRVDSWSWLVLWLLASWLLLWFWPCVSDRLCFLCSDVACLICSFDLCSFDIFLSALLICPLLSKFTLLSRSSRTDTRTPCPSVAFRLLVKLSREQLLLTSVAATKIFHLAVA